VSYTHLSYVERLTIADGQRSWATTTGLRRFTLKTFRGVANVILRKTLPDAASHPA